MEWTPLLLLGIGALLWNIQVRLKNINETIKSFQPSLELTDDDQIFNALDMHAEK